MIDFHCHLDLYPNPPEIIDGCRRRGLYVLSVTTTPTAWRGTSALATHAPRIWTALGLHPQLAHERLSELTLFDQLLPQTTFVGEIGLDGASQHWHDQVVAFEHILVKCSAAGGRIMTIHSRRATRAVLDRIGGHQNAGTFVLHWFSGSARELERAIELGCWFSVGPAMLRTNTGRALISRMPRDRILPESDGPFASLSGAPILPWQVDLVVEELSSIWSVQRETVDEMLVASLRNLMGMTGSLQNGSHLGT